ncbi:MAG: hypothetical protein WB780_07350 [Candidatus Acidiferrales bacterium]
MVKITCLGGSDPAAWVVKAGDGADGADDGAAGGDDSAGVFDDEIESGVVFGAAVFMSELEAPAS